MHYERISNAVNANGAVEVVFLCHFWDLEIASRCLCNVVWVSRRPVGRPSIANMVAEP